MKLLNEDKGYKYIGKSVDGLFKFMTAYGDIVAYSRVKFLTREGQVLFGAPGDDTMHLSNKVCASE